MKKPFIFIPLLFIGCASSLNVKNPKSDNADFSSKTMVLWPFVSRDLLIYNTDDVVDDFGKTDNRESHAIVRDSCFSVMQEEIVKNEKSIKVCKISTTAPLISLNPNACFTIICMVGKDSMLLPFSIPKRDSIQFKPDVILILNKISFSRFSGSAGSPGIFVTTGMAGSSFMPGMGGSPPSLNSTFNYLLWSYTDSEAICYGQTTAETGFLFAMTHKTWITHFKNIAHSLFSKTPFPLWKEPEKPVDAPAY